MRRYLLILSCCQTVLFPSRMLFAEDYSQCIARCAETYTDCMNQPQAEDPEVEAAK